MKRKKCVETPSPAPKCDGNAVSTVALTSTLAEVIDIMHVAQSNHAVITAQCGCALHVILTTAEGSKQIIEMVVGIPVGTNQH